MAELVPVNDESHFRNWSPAGSVNDGTRSGGYLPFLAKYASTPVWIVLTSVLQAAFVPRSVIPPTANSTIPARMPRITITIMSSMRVNPPSSRARSIMRCMFPSSQLTTLLRSMTDEGVCVRHPSLRHPRAAPSHSSELHLVVDAVHRGDHRDGDEPHGTAHEQDHRRFEQRGKTLNLEFEFFAVEVRANGQLLVQGAGVLPYLDHLDDGTREQLHVGHRPREA